MEVNDTIIMVYFLVAINFMINRMKDFSCHAQNLLDTNLTAKHAFNLASIFFVIVLFTRMNPIHPTLLVIMTCVLYMFFMIITRCEYRFLIMFLICMVVVFFIEATKAYYKHKENETRKYTSAAAITTQKQLQEMQTTLIKIQYMTHALSILFVFIGFLVYLGQKSREYPDWSWNKFWMGVGQCETNGIPKRLKRNVLHDVLHGVKRIVTTK